MPFIRSLLAMLLAWLRCDVKNEVMMWVIHTRGVLASSSYPPPPQAAKRAIQGNQKALGLDVKEEQTQELLDLFANRKKCII